MVADADLQVWLDTQINVGQMVIIPYVKTVKDVLVDFRMNVIQKGAVGTSRITQEGRINAVAAKPTPLARLALGAQKNGECSVELVLREGEGDSRTYEFDCTAK